MKLDPRSADATIYTDASRLTQVFVNLLSNAVKFSPRGQEVVLTITTSDDRLCIAVRDHGPGIPDEFKTRIFEKFVQLRFRCAAPGGTGLALSIAKQIMIRLGGDVSHDAAPDGGTIFRIDMPRRGRAGCNRAKARAIWRRYSKSCAQASAIYAYSA